MPLVLNGATSGSATLVATDTTTNTLTLPIGTGTLLSSANPQSGGVIQVVSSNPTGLVSTSSTTFVTSGFSASITPKFSTSKILVSFSGYCYINIAIQQETIAIYRGGSAIAQTGVAYGSASGVSSASSLNFLDSPATTSPITYTIYFKVASGTAIGYINADAASNTTITLMEIAA